MKTTLTILALMLMSVMLQAQTTKQSDSIEYHHKNYKAVVGSKGGLYCILEDGSKHYASADRVRTASKPIDNGDGTAKYRGADWKIFTGTRNGKYIVVNGARIYLPRS